MVFVKPNKVAERDRKAYFVRLKWVESETLLETRHNQRETERVQS